MINYIQIQNFKSLHKVGFKTANLNLLFGLNGMGKSSIIQSLLLLRQSYYMNRFSFNILSTNGNLIKLGTQKDIFYQKSDELELFKFLLFFTGDIKLDLNYKYDISSNDSDTLHINNEVSTYLPIEEIKKLPLFSEGFYYLGANHINPMKSYEMSGYWNAQINILGSSGQYAPQYFAKHYSQIVNESMCHPKAKSKMLIDQMNAWMSELSPGIRLSAEYFASLEQSTLQMRYENDKDLSDVYSTVNVGFGIPYVFPVILILLITKPGDLVLLENPESHLHPRGQSTIAKMIAAAANSGVQIFCESHSDHIINGIRVAVKKQELDPQKLAIYYFRKEFNLETQIELVEVDKHGSLNKYPEGLLDEWGLLMSELL